MSLNASATCHKLAFVFLASLAISFISYLPSVAANLDHTCYSDRPIRYEGVCGKALVNAHTIACFNFQRFLDRSIMKRSSPKELERTVHGLQINKKNAMSFLVKRQGTQGIYCECCVHSCGTLELIQYC